MARKLYIALPEYFIIVQDLLDDDGDDITSHVQRCASICFKATIEEATQFGIEQRKALQEKVDWPLKKTDMRVVECDFISNYTDDDNGVEMTEARVVALA